MKRHKMTVDVTLEMPDGHRIEDARKAVQEALRGLSQVGTVSVKRISGARPWTPKEKDSHGCDAYFLFVGEP